jgi:putative spermidine/putrescine transport system permease protein
MTRPKLAVGAPAAPLPAQLPDLLRLARRIGLYAVALVAIFGPLSSLFIWSVAEKWFWPNLFPQKLGFLYWGKVLQGDMLNALILSFEIATLVTIAVLLLTVPLAYALVRWNMPAKVLIMILFLLPQTFPQLPVFANTAVLMYRWDLAGTLTGVVLIHMVGALVYALWTLVAVFKAIPVSMEEAAVNLSASRFRTFWDIALPLALPGIFAASLLVFLHSLDEFTGTLMVGAPYIMTLPVYMYTSAMGYELQVSSITGLLLMSPGLLILVLLERYMKSEYLSAFGRL